jgi:hypothetical protein
VTKITFLPKINNTKRTHTQKDGNHSSIKANKEAFNYSLASCQNLSMASSAIVVFDGVVDVYVAKPQILLLVD